VSSVVSRSAGARIVVQNSALGDHCASSREHQIIRFAQHRSPQTLARACLCVRAACQLSCGPALARAVRPFLRPALRRADCRCRPEQSITFFARSWWEGWWCRRERPVARRVPCAAPHAALCVPCGVPAVVLFARFAVPDGAPSQTSAHLRAASWAWEVEWRFGHQPATPPKLRARPPAQTQSRI